MVNISKEYFDSNITGSTPCSAWHSWNSNCSESISDLCCNAALGCCKFFLPIYLLKIALNWKKVDRKYLKAQLVAFLKSQCYGVTYVFVLSASFCLFVNLYRFYYYMVFASGALGGLSILLECQENKSIDAILYFNQTIEALLNYAEGEKIISRTPANETLIFMFISSLSMYLFKTQNASKKITSLWFYPVPSLKHRQSSDGSSPPTVCKHKDSCLQHSYKEAVKYFCMGYVLEIIKSALPRFLPTILNPRKLARVLVNRKNVLFGLFFGGYVAIYRYTSCLLLRKDRREVAGHALIAGFLAGCTYYLKPNLQVGIICFTTAVQLLSQRLIQAYNLPEGIPYYLIVFCLSSGFLCHFRFLLADYCPRYTKNMTNITTNNMAERIHSSVLNTFFGA